MYVWEEVFHYDYELRFSTDPRLEAVDVPHAINTYRLFIERQNPQIINDVLSAILHVHWGISKMKLRRQEPEK